MTEEPGDADPDIEPVRVTENVISAWRWDAWLQQASRIDRRAAIVSIVLGVAAAVGAAIAGYAYLPGEARLSVIVYAPVLGYVIDAWLPRSWITTRPLRAVLSELRPEVVPRLVSQVDDEQLLRLLVHGGALLPEVSTRLAAERRDAALALVAYVYDLSTSPIWDAGSAGGG